MIRGRLVASLLRAGGANGFTVRGFAATSTKEKTKEPKSPRKISGYMLFMKDASGKLRKTGIPFTEISRQLAKEWTQISAAQRQKFIDEATRLNEQTKIKKTEKEKPVVEKENKPKRRLNVYAEFSKSVWPDVQRQYPDKSFVEKSKIIGDMWKNVSPEEKERRKKALQKQSGM